MRARLQTVLNKLASFPGLRLVPWMDRQWQQSSAVSASFWILNTYILFKLVEHFGHGVRTSVLVSLGWDTLTFAVNRFWIWRRSKVGLKSCYSRNFAVWLIFFGINAGLFWMLKDPASLSVHHTRYILGAVGIAINPWRFRINKERIFEDAKAETA
jgi:hypothetical protein